MKREFYDLGYDRETFSEGGDLMGRGPILAATGIAICMLLAACGSGDGELSKAEFVDQGNAICVHAREHLSKRSRQSKLGGVYAATAEALQTEADEIGALGAPSADADRIEAILESARQVATTLEKSEGGRDKKSVEKATEEMTDAERLAASYGLAFCLIT